MMSLLYFDCYISIGFKLYICHFYLGREGPGASCFQFGDVDADVAVDYEDIALAGPYHILVVQVAEIDVGSGIRPVAGIDECESYVLCKGIDFGVAYFRALYIRLFNNDLEIAISESSESDYCQPCFGEKSIVQ